MGVNMKSRISQKLEGSIVVYLCLPLLIRGLVISASCHTSLEEGSFHPVPLWTQSYDLTGKWSVSRGDVSTVSEEKI